VIDPITFYSHLCWLDGRPLLETIEPYRRKILSEALFTFEGDGKTPRYNLVLTGRGKKNWKTADLILAAFYRFFVWDSGVAGNDCFLLANDEGQASDDLSLAKKLVWANPILATEVAVQSKAIERLDGRGTLRILPAGDVSGSHGKTYSFVGFDEIHGFRSWDLFEALAPDPTRPDALTWITSYDSIFNTPGVPLHDLKKQAGSDPRMYFSWYSADLCTDSDLALSDDPEAKANPSMGSWPEGRGYLEQQRRRLPTSKYRRLHLNLPGAPDGAFFDAGKVLACVAPGRRRLRPRERIAYRAFVDMSGGSSDDAVLAIGHEEDGLAVVDLVENQGGGVPFDPRIAVMKFARLLGEYRVSRVVGDRYAGETFRRDFERHGIGYRVSPLTKSQLYEEMEPRVNAREVELPDVPRMQEQLLTLVRRGARVDHQSGDHDDWANGVAGLIDELTGARRPGPAKRIKILGL
jgi:hypothetical protein